MRGSGRRVCERTGMKCVWRVGERWVVYGSLSGVGEGDLRSKIGFAMTEMRLYYKKECTWKS